MIRNLLIIFVFTIGVTFGVHAQVNLVLENNSEVFSFSFDDTEDEQQIGFSLQNNTEEDLGWFWKAELSEDFPSDWEFQLCDLNLCYVGDLKAQLENILKANEKTQFTRTYMKIKNKGVAGNGEVKLEIFGDKNFENLLVSTDFTSSTEEASYDDITIYPNPTTDYFSFTDDTSIAQVSIHNIVGKEVMSMYHDAGKKYDVSDLRNGMYLVRLLDKNSKVIKSLRLSKR